MPLIYPASKVQVHLLHKKREFSADIEERVREIWTEAENQGKHNGSMLAYDSLSLSNEGIEINCVSGEYRHYYAQVQDQSLGMLCQIMAVTGVIEDSTGRYLLARRGENVTTFQNCLEFPPSGGLSLEDVDAKRVQARKGIIRELEEETLYSPSSITSLQPLGLVHYTELGVLDIAYHIKLAIPFKEKSIRQEYGEEFCLTAQEVREKTRKEESVPSVEILLDLLGK